MELFFIFSLSFIEVLYYAGEKLLYFQSYIYDFTKDNCGNCVFERFS